MASGGYVPGVVNGGTLLQSPSSLPVAERILSVSTTGQIIATTDPASFEEAGAIALAIEAHKMASDPHLDRVYTDSALSTKSDIGHTHLQGEIDGLTGDLAAKASLVHQHTISDVNGLQTELSGKASSVHSHTISEVAGLQTALDGKASTSHTHTLSSVTDAGTAASKDVAATGDATSGQVVLGSDSRLTDNRTPSAHNQAWSTITATPTTLAGYGIVDAAASSHSHAISDVTGLQTALDGKASSSHTHTLSAITDAGTAAAKNFPATGDAASAEVVLGSDSRLSDSRTPVTHNQAWSTITSTPTTLAGYGIADAAAATHSHAISDVTGLQTALDGKASTSHTHALAAITDAGTAAAKNHPATGDAASGEVVLGSDTRLTDARTPVTHNQAWSTITSTPTTLAGYGISDAAAATHSHAISDVTGLQTALDGKASSSHSHAISDVTGLQTALDGKSDTSHNHTVDGLSNVSISGKASGDLLRWNGSNWVNYPDSNFAAASHSHTFASLTSKPTTLSGYGISDAQGLDAELTAIAGLTSAADRFPYFTGAGTAALATVTSAARNLLDDTTAGAMATTLGLGAASAVQFGSAVIGDGATGNPRINIDAPAGASSGIAWKVGGVFRWLFYTTNPESGSDAGSDLVFGRAFTDAGVGIDNPITVARAAGGNITIARPLSCNDTVNILSSLTFSDNRHIVTNAATGTKIATATTQKLAFWNKTPIIQPTTGVTGATRVGGGGTTLTDTDTFDGYTLAKVVAALRNTGLLA